MRFKVSQGVRAAGPASIPGLASCDRVVWMTTIASVSFNVSAFESTVVASTLSILRVVVFASAVVRILKCKIAIGPFAIGFCPPARRQKYRYGFRAVHWRDLPESIAALPNSGASPSNAINCAGKTTSHCKATELPSGLRVDQDIKRDPIPRSFGADDLRGLA